MTVPPTPAALSLAEKQERVRRLLLERISRTRTEPASFAQERLWFVDRMQNAGATYNMPEALRLRGALDAAALERALGEVVNRHEALRTTLAEVDGTPMQVIRPFSGYALPVRDLSALPAAEREAQVARLADDDAARPFDLAAGPLFRAELLRLAEDEHVLLLCVHHVVSDGWSMGVLFREMWALYGAFAEGRPSPLRALPLQYADYAAWQRRELGGGALTAQLAYWKERLAGAPALLELPTDHPRPAVQRQDGASEHLQLPAALVERLQAVARREGATLYMVVLGAFQVLLGRYAGTDDVVVGSPFAGRTDVEIEELIGFFVNTLVMRTELGGDPSFREVIGRVRAATLEAYAHQDVPFERLVAELQPERTPGRSPLYQVVFTLNEGARGGASTVHGLRVSPVDARIVTSKFDLLLALTPDGGGLAGEMVYRTDLFDAQTIRRMGGHLVRLLEQVAADAEVRISRIALPDAAERALVIDEWNRTTTVYPSHASLHGLVAEQARRAPDAVAVIADGQTLTYGELDTRANRLANHLLALGVTAEARVGLCVERGAEMIVAMLAILRAGAAYVPLDPDYPAERLAFMIADSGVRVLLTQESLRGSVGGAGLRVVSVDGDRETIAAARADDPGIETGPRGLAYVIYTSGSTGTPKGVAVEHRSVVRLVCGTDYVHFGAGDCVGQASNAAFDAATFEVWGALLNGGRLVVIPRDAVLSARALEETIRAHGITILFLTTSLFNGIARERPEVFRTLGTLVFGGEAADPVAVRRVLRAGAPGRLVNGYGPTENTTFSAAYRVQTLADDAVSVPIGRTLAHSTLLVLDDALQPAPIGVPGELYVGGDGVARGYLGRPALTAERFVPDPFSAGPGARMYRTGDRVRWTSAGVAEYLGRLDGQVKVRGFRIELGEIEAVLGDHPRVAECAVVTRTDGAGTLQVVAYVVGGADAEELRAHLRRTLPDYMVPAAFVPLDALPITPNGKLDRRALPDPDFSAAADAYAAPRTPAEEVLAGIWAEVLGVPRAGVHDDFFALGGHSLLATRVVSRVRTVFGVELPLRDLFEAPTVARVAERVEALRRAGQPQLPPVVPVERTGGLPLSFAQERLWFLDRMEPDSPFYNVPAAVRLGGALDVAALERALGEIVHRHEALRTVFREEGGAPVQVITPFTGFSLGVGDLSGWADDEREAEVQRHAAEEAARPFDLAAGPLFRAGLLRLADADHVLLVSIHHVVSDGWSLGVLFRELWTLYGAFAEGRPSPLAPLALQYADYAVWQRQQLRGEVLDAQLAYWKERLAGAPALLELPTDHPRPAVQSYRGASEPVELPAELVDALRAVARREGTTLYMLLLGAFQVLLGRYAGTDDVVVGSPIAGRTRPEVEGLIGFFVNTLVLRTDLSGDPAFRDVLRRVRDVTLGAYAHQDVPFERLVAELHPDRSLSRSPLFQVMFALNEIADQADGLPALRMAPVEVESDTSKFDLLLALAPDGDGLAGAVSYSTDLFDAGTIRRMTGHLRRVLEQVAADADVRVSRIALVDAAERALVVEEWNRTTTAYPADAAVHALFAEQARRAPDAVAVISHGQAVTYGELDARANRLAHHLLSLGVTPEARVGLCLERGAELLAAILGILKAGAAYVPLDPEYPRDRLAFMLADSGVRVLLTQRSLRGSVDGAGVRVVSVDEERGTIAAARADDPGIATGPRGLACVIYTSGSTGTPKGVAVEHRSVGRLVRGTDYMTLDAGNRIGQASNAAFDAATFEIWAALLNGGALVVIPREVALSAELLADAIRVNAINTLFLTTSLFNGIARERPEVFSPLATVMFGGEAADPVAVRRVLGTAGAPRMLNLYGPTENTTFSSWHDPAGLADDAQTVPIGRAVANSTLLVLDDALQPAPIGVPGEMYVGGHGVARGYLGRPALTAERFVPDPFSAEPGARMYRTGDRVRWTSAGVTEYLGRLDGQVKVRGFRIELGEIEATLGRHPRVAECTVATRVDAAGTLQVVAYVVGGADAEELRAHLRRTLPDYMVPAALVPLDALPITPNGKLDRRALPDPDFSAAADAYAAPRTPAEEVLAGIWAEVLGLPRAGVHDDFFALGGHSLLATRVVSRVRAVFGVELPLRQLFEAPTVARVAERVEALRRAGLPQLPPVVAVERTGGMPLSFAQERLWFLDRMEPDGASYNVPVAVRVEGALDAAALERALGEVIHRHEALRTAFPEVNGAPVQVINPFAGFSLPVVEVDGEAEVRRRVAEAAARPFDLAAGPLLVATLLRLADDDHVLLVCMHHIVTDGWSLPVLFRELWTLYDAFTAGRPSPLAPLAVQYADFAVWQRQQLRGDALNRQLAYWTERLGDAPPLLELPTDRPRPVMQSYRGGHEPVRIPARVVERLGALARAEGATLYMVLLGAFQVLLGKYAATDDVVVGSPIAGRTRREVEELIGFFVNTLVLRTDLGGNPTFRDVVRRVRDVTLGGWEHQDLPFERLVEALQPERSLSHAPVVQVTFALNMDHAEADTAGPRTHPVELEIATTKFDLSLALAPDGDEVRGEMEYASDLFDRASIVKMLDRLYRVLDQVTADADVRIGALDLLDDAERAVVVDEWNRTDAPYPATCIHSLFEAQAARTPHALAATDGTQSVTYAELDARANRLAHHLVSLGVGTETRVAIGLARGVEMLVAMMAVLKAGGAYVPLDPAYPADRLAFTLRDARVAVMLTQESLRTSLPVEDGVRVVSVDEPSSAAAIAAQSADGLGARADARNLAYLIYTSGSTGVPKGVAIEHDNAIALLTWAADLHTAEELGGMLACTSICFDLSVYELFLPLSLGGRVIIVENALALPSSPSASDVRLVNTVPSAAAALLASGGIPAGVTTVNLAGEPLRTELVDALYAHGIQRVYDLYGPSEDTTYSTWTLRIAGAAPTIGRPISNTRAYVLDAGQRPVPAGVAGELYLAGRGLARGYLGRAALTAERFIPDPFTTAPGERMYRTGDRVRWTSTGNLEYLGRVDAQVKVRGYRIELGEIETALRRHDAVRDCVVVAREDVPGEKRLAAYVAGEVEAETLRAHLRQSLPEYMVPAAFVVMDALPLTPNGKLDRKALPAPEFAGTADALPPRNALEHKVAEVWREVLGVAAPGVTDNFFDLGGTSLLLYRVFSSLRELKSGLKMVDLFRHTTVEALAAFLGEGEQGEDPALAASRARAQERRSARRRG